MDNLNLEVNGFGLINEANIDINKINIIGGVNSSGKSTIARLLYCYLKADVLNDDEYIRKVLVEKIQENLVGLTLNPEIPLSNAIREYKSVCPQNDDIDSLINLLSKGKQFSYTWILRNLIHKENLDSFEGYSKFHNYSFESLLGNKYDKDQFDDGFIELKDELEKEPQDGREDYYDFCGDDGDYELIDPYYGGWYLDEYEKIDFRQMYEYEQDMESEYGDEFVDEFDIRSKLYMYKTKGSLNVFNDVFYIDSLSILDMIEFINSEKDDENKMDVIYPKNHIRYLINALTDRKSIRFLFEKDNETSEASQIIHDVINGNVESPFNRSTGDFYYYQELENEDLSMGLGTGNTASGIKQIGMVQLLLSYEKLGPNSFLIIDEPEVNLHPDWQFKFAEILVLLVKDLDITIYLNSHSPFFIEAMDAFTEYYDMQDDVNYYLNEKPEGEDKYYFNKINSDELYKIYDNLGKSYDLIDQIRLRKHLGE